MQVLWGYSQGLISHAGALGLQPGRGLGQRVVLAYCAFEACNVTLRPCAVHTPSPPARGPEVLGLRFLPATEQSKARIRIPTTSAGRVRCAAQCDMCSRVRCATQCDMCSRVRCAAQCDMCSRVRCAAQQGNARGEKGRGDYAGFGLWDFATRSTSSVNFVSRGSGLGSGLGLRLSLGLQLGLSLGWRGASGLSYNHTRQETL